MNVGWLETSFAVADVERTSAWYRKLGFQVVSTADEGKNQTLEAGECRVSLYQGILSPAETQLIFWNGEVEACAEKLAAAGAEILPNPHAAGDETPNGLAKAANGDASLMVRDPDGQLIYIIRMAEVTRKRAAGSDLDRGFFQVSLPVEDPDGTAAFYELLGFQRKASDDPNMAPLTNGECRICLYKGYLDPAELQLNFWQGDIDAVAALARREGLAFYREPSRSERGAGVMLKDPDGRPVFFINMKKYSAANFVTEAGEMLA